MDFPITANEVGTLITYVAPGFLLQLGYREKFPAPERSAGWVLIVSLVLSLPLVAIAVGITDWLGGSHRPLAVGYAVSLTLGAFLLGYLVAVIRETRWMRKILAFFDYWAQPESSIYAQTLLKIGGAAEIEVHTLDGKHLRGVPTIAPLAKDDGIEELHLSRLSVEKEGEFVQDENWKSALVPLSQLTFMALVVDPISQDQWMSYKAHWASWRKKRLDKKNHGNQSAPDGTAADSLS